MKIRADVAELLHQGHSNLAIARATGAAPKTVAASRQALGIPPARPGRYKGSTLNSRFQERTEPLADGHMRWTGYRTNNGTPSIYYGGHAVTAGRMAFLLRWGREPIGRVKAGCDMHGCVAPDHVLDQPMRDQLNTTFTAIFGPVTS